MSSQVTEGTAAFAIAGIDSPCMTWYKVYGDLKSSRHRPVVIAHGGPGMTHDYLLPLTSLASISSLPVVFYDQIGSGRSTHLPEKNGDKHFWCDDLFMEQFESLLEHLGIQDDYDALGHSWGGMFLSRYAARQPKGLKHLVIADAPASVPDFVQSMNDMRANLPEDVKARLQHLEDSGLTGSPEYTLLIMANFYVQFACTSDGPLPEGLAASFEWQAKDPSVSATLTGTLGYFERNGLMKEWSVINTGELGRVSVPTLVIHGEKDIANSTCVLPYFQQIPQARLYTVPNASHLPYLEQTAIFTTVVSQFLTEG